MEDAVPIYLVTIKAGEGERVRLVNAQNEARALRHVTEKHIEIESVRTPEQMTAMAQLAAKGVEVEVAE